MLLLNFGILSKRINNILEIEGSYLKRLYDEIIRYSVDTELWDDYFSKHPEYSTIEDIYFDTIISIEPSKYTKTVYDFTVPYEHSFVANGIINHNTTLLLERIRTLVEEVRIPQEDILTISFTRASSTIIYLHFFNAFAKPNAIFESKFGFVYSSSVNNNQSSKS